LGAGCGFPGLSRDLGRASAQKKVLSDRKVLLTGALDTKKHMISHCNKLAADRLNLD